MARLLLVDDEATIRKGILAKLAHAGLVFDEVLEASDGVEALSLLERYDCDVLLTDIRMPRMDGLALLKAMQERGIRSAPILVSGYADFEYARRAISFGVNDYLLKPIGEAELVAAVSKVLHSLPADRRNRSGMQLRPVPHPDVPSGLSACHPEEESGLAVTIPMDAHAEARGTQKVREVLAHIDTHYREELSLHQLAQMAGMSPGYFSTLFRQVCGQTVVGHITEVRIRRAESLLLETRLGVSDVALSVGYEDPQYFFRVFKKTVGVTPLEYRNRSAI